MKDDTSEAKMKTGNDEAPKVKRLENEPVESPGSIKSDVSLLLHTKEALKLFMGRKEDKTLGVQHIPGVSVYAKLLRVIWGSCLAGDPFARFWIQKFEIKLAEAELDLKQYLEGLLQQQEDSILKRLNISKSLSVKPVEVHLSFATPYTYKIVYCLILLDEIVAKLITLRHMALISPVEFDRGIRDSRGAIHRMLSGIGGFKPMGVTLLDARERNAKYIEAVEIMGELPEVILANKYTPEFFPTKKLKIAGFGRRRKVNKTE